LAAFPSTIVSFSDMAMSSDRLRGGRSGSSPASRNSFLFQCSASVIGMVGSPQTNPWWQFISQNTGM